MPGIGRRRVLGAGLGAAAALGAPWVIPGARAAEFAYKFGHGFPVTHPFHTHLQSAVDRIREESKGRLEIEIFGNNQLGGDTQMLTQVRAGAIQFFEGGGIILSILVPEASISGMGFIFKDYAAVWQALDGEVGAYIRAGFERKGLHAFEKMWDNGFRHISSSTHPIVTPADLKGFKIRVPPGQLYTSLFQSIGAAPTSINLAETYSALQTRIVEGQENPLVVFNTAKYYEVQKYVSLTGHVWDGVWLIANPAAWQALPPELQAIVARGFNEAGEAQRAEVARTNAALAEDLKQKGVTLNQPDQQPFREALRQAGFYKEWSGKYSGDGWSLLEKQVGKLT